MEFDVLEGLHDRWEPKGYDCGLLQWIHGSLDRHSGRVLNPKYKSLWIHFRYSHDEQLEYYVSVINNKDFILCDCDGGIMETIPVSDPNCFDLLEEQLEYFKFLQAVLVHAHPHIEKQREQERNARNRIS